MSELNFKERFSVLRPHIIKAGEKIKQMRDNGEVVSEIKEDQSPVTNADVWANKYLKDGISSHFPGEIIIGEEDDDKSYKPGTEVIWFFDPIDGTKAYLGKSIDYFILVGLCVNGQPVLGIHYQPETKKMIYGWTDGGIFFQKADSEPEEITTKRQWNADPHFYIKTHDTDLRNAVKELGITRATYAKGMVDMLAPLSGHADGYISLRPTAYWDLCAPAAIMNAAGFVHPGKKNGQKPILFNDGLVKTSFYYSLPPDTPDLFLEQIKSIHLNR